MYGIKSYLKYLFIAHYRNGHHVHSPYTYRVCRNVLYERWDYYCFDRIEHFRKVKHYKSQNARYEQIMMRLCVMNGCKNIVDVEPDDGLSTMYLASVDTRNTVKVLKSGHDDTAKKNWEMGGYVNIELLDSIYEVKSFDFLCFNGPFERLETEYEEYKKRASNDSVIAVRGIHSCSKAEHLWENIVKDNDVRISMDFFGMGVIWLNPQYQKQHYYIKL
ncbi:MAG: hypothetical protein MJZ95_01205 [Paludibacteraceae bacterium]|nr:hypothetical protein [Paludibacteraceae bacterium]